MGCVLTVALPLRIGAMYEDKRVAPTGRVKCTRSDELLPPAEAAARCSMRRVWSVFSLRRFMAKSTLAVHATMALSVIITNTN